MGRNDDDEPIHCLPVPDWLPGILVLHQPLGVLMHLSCEQGIPCLHWAQKFTDNERSVLLPLFDQYPDYCPLEVMLASFLGSTSERAIERARKTPLTTHAQRLIAGTHQVA